MTRLSFLALGAGMLLVSCSRRSSFSGALEGGSFVVGDAELPESTRPANDAPPLPAEAVSRAYAALAAGKVDEARALFAALGKPGPLDAAGDVVPLGGRVLLPTSASCDFGDVGANACLSILTHAGGSCDGGKLTTRCGTLLVDPAASKVVAFYPGGGTRAVGPYLVTSARAGTSAVRRADTLDVLLEAPGDVVSAVGDGKELVAVARVTPRRGEDAAFEVRRVAPESHRVSAACRVVTHGDDPTFFRLLGDELLVRAGSVYTHVTLCSADMARVVGHWAAVGEETTALDATGRTLFVSGIEAVPPPADPTGQMPTSALFDHLAVDVASGRTERTRTREGTADVPGRDTLFVDAASTLVVSHGYAVTFFATHPLRRVAESQITIPGLDSSYSATLALHPLGTSDGVLGEYVVEGSGPSGPTRTTLAWFLSARARKVLFEGTAPGPLRAEGARAGFVMTPRDEQGREVIFLDGGTWKRRALAPGEKEDALPELAGLPVVPSGVDRLVPRTFAEPSTHGANAPSPRSDVANAFVAVAGLPVPRVLFTGR